MRAKVPKYKQPHFRDPCRLNEMLDVGVVIEDSGTSIAGRLNGGRSR